jgi:hypothetical protein
MAKYLSSHSIPEIKRKHEKMKNMIISISLMREYPYFCDGLRTKSFMNAKFSINIFNP